MLSSKKVLVASGSRHSIPPVHNSPGVPRIIFQLTEKNIRNFEFVVLSKYDKSLDAMSFDSNKYLHSKPNLRIEIFERFLRILPYRWRKRKYGFSQPDRIIYYTSLVRKAKQLKPDIVITFMHVELFKMLKKALPEAKHVFFYRSTDLESRIGGDNIDFILRHSAGFLANTKAPIDELCELAKNISFPMDAIYNSVPLVTLSLEQQERIGAQFRKKFGLKSTDFVLGYAGRFSKEKSLMELFEVMKALKEKGVVAHLIIAGDIANEKTPNKSYYSDLMAFREMNLKNQVHLAGWITNSELYHFYCALDVGVLLSKYREGNSMFLIEAMSYGVPVAATNIGGNIEIVQDGLNGALIDNKNLNESLYSFILKLISDSTMLKKLGVGAIATTIEKHSIEKMILRFHNFLNKV